MRILGGSIGISTASILLRNEITNKLGGRISPEDVRKLGGGLESFDQHNQIAIIDAYSTAFRTGMMISAIIAGVAVLVSVLGLRRTRMDMNEQRTKLFREEELRRANISVSTQQVKAP